jgi:hypothetical protein
VGHCGIFSAWWGEGVEGVGSGIHYNDVKDTKILSGFYESFDCSV